jgi:hypothetical protein
MFLKTHFMNFINLDVSRVTGFLEFPNNVLQVASMKQGSCFSESKDIVLQYVLKEHTYMSIDYWS